MRSQLNFHPDIASVLRRLRADVVRWRHQAALVIGDVLLEHTTGRDYVALLAPSRTRQWTAR